MRDAGTNPDAGSSRDGGETERDGGESSRDGGSPRDAEPAGEETCNGAFTLDGVVTGAMRTDRTLLPGSATPIVVAPIVEAETAVTGALSQLTSTRLEWHAQVSHFTQFDMIHYEHVLRDPADGAIYALVAQQVQRDATALRVYHAKGDIAVDLVRDGTPGYDLVGAGRQSNFILIKYNASGTVQWVSRFGPNRPNTDRAGTTNTIGLTPTGVRVIASVEGATDIVFAPGAESENVYAAPGPVAFWGEIAKADGGYVAGSFRYVAASAGASGALTALAYHGHAAGASVMAGSLFRPNGSATFTIGEGGAGATTVTSTTSLAFAAKLDATGAPAFVATAVIDDQASGPSMRGVGISPTGDVVAGGQFGARAGTMRFTSGGATTSLAFQPDNSFLVALSPTGAVRWVKRLAGGDRNAVSRILVTADAAYVLGTYRMGEVLGVGEPNETVLGVNAYVLAKYAVADGALQWARAFTSANGMQSSAAYDVWLDGTGGLVVPAVIFPELRVVGGGIDRILRPIEPAMLGGVRFDVDGSIVDCEAIALGASSFVPL